MLTRFSLQVSLLRKQYRTDLVARLATLAFLGAGAAIVAIAILRDLTRHLGVHIPFEAAFSLTRDRSVPEIFMYLCEATCSASCLIRHRRTGEYAFLFMALLFGFIVLDDALSYHEVLGGIIVAHLGYLSPLLQSQETGELISWSIAALLLVPPLLWCLWHIRPGEVGVYLVFGLVFAILVFFAVGMDLAHSAVESILDPKARMTKAVLRVVGWLEDGGELIMVTVAAATGLLFARVPQST